MTRRVIMAIVIIFSGLYSNASADVVCRTAFILPAGDVAYFGSGRDNATAMQNAVNQCKSEHPCGYGTGCSVGLRVSRMQSV